MRVDPVLLYYHLLRSSLAATFMARLGGYQGA